MTPTLSSRSANVCDPTSPLGEIRRRLHVSAVPQTLPCREDEFHYLFSFVEGDFELFWEINNSHDNDICYNFIDY